MKKQFSLILIQVIMFVAGCAMLATVSEPTYEELLNPIPFIGMLLCLISIVLGFIIGIFEK